jgi:hypothetical protein
MKRWRRLVEQALKARSLNLIEASRDVQLCELVELVAARR